MPADSTYVVLIPVKLAPLPTKLDAVIIPVAFILVDCKLATVDTPEELMLPIKLPIKPNAVTTPLILAPIAVKIPIGDINCPLVLAMDFYPS
jgi:hypothetical protein